MEYRRLGDTIAVRLDRGEEILSCMKEIALKESIQVAIVQGIGATDQVSFGLYNVEMKKYLSHTYEQPFEIISLEGNITRREEQPYLHLHIVLGDEAGNSFGGHLNMARIGGTAEIFIKILDGKIERKIDPMNTGLQVFQLDDNF